MEVLFHFIFQIVKISILSLIYIFILAAISQLPFFKKIKFLNDLNHYKRTRVITWFVLGFILFIWSFTYWGSHGLGDYARIPIGYGRQIERINATITYITPEGHELETYGINEFATENKFCFGKSRGMDKTVYFIWNLESNKIVKYKSKRQYIKQLSKHGIKNPKYNTFYEAYDNYWNGWRFWLLP